MSITAVVLKSAASGVDEVFGSAVGCLSLIIQRRAFFFVPNAEDDYSDVGGECQRPDCSVTGDSMVQAILRIDVSSVSKGVYVVRANTANEPCKIQSWLNK